MITTPRLAASSLFAAALAGNKQATLATVVALAFIWMSSIIILSLSGKGGFDVNEPHVPTGVQPPREPPQLSEVQKQAIEKQRAFYLRVNEREAERQKALQAKWTARDADKPPVPAF